jgi:hypothetical protein
VNASSDYQKLRAHLAFLRMTAAAEVTQMQDGAALAVCGPRIAILAPSSSDNSTTAAARMPGAGRWRTPTGAQGKSS